MIISQGLLVSATYITDLKIKKSTLQLQFAIFPETIGAICFIENLQKGSN